MNNTQKNICNDEQYNMNRNHIDDSADNINNIMNGNNNDNKYQYYERMQT